MATFAVNPAAAADAPVAKVCNPHFVGPLEVLANDDGRTLTLTKQYKFVDSRCVQWAVPPKAKVDGASIPRLFWTVTGGPLEGRYRNASVIHDWFCDRRSRPWRSVHRMFLEAMLAGGVEPAKANLMYLAVYYGGPRWSIATIRNNQLALGDCKACASVSGSQGNDSFAMKAARPVQNVVFDHTTPDISQAAFDDIARKIGTGNATSPEEIEALVDTLRAPTQACPSGFRQASGVMICDPR